MNYLLAPVLLILFTAASAQKHVYDVELLGKSIGSMTVERLDKGNGEVEYKLNSSSAVNLLFTQKTSVMTMDVVYRDGKLLNSYCKNIKDDATEIVTIFWDGFKYVIKKGEEVFHYDHPIDFSSVLLYYADPGSRKRIFSERLGQFTDFLKLADGVYQCKLNTGVNNTYHYKNGLMYELEMSKGASVFLKLIR